MANYLDWNSQKTKKNKNKKKYTGKKKKITSTSSIARFVSVQFNPTRQTHRRRLGGGTKYEHNIVLVWPYGHSKTDPVTSLPKTTSQGNVTCPWARR